MYFVRYNNKNIKFKYMSTKLVELSTDSIAMISDYQARVTAVGVALLFAYVVLNN